MTKQATYQTTDTLMNDMLEILTNRKSGDCTLTDFRNELAAKGWTKLGNAGDFLHCVEGFGFTITEKWQGRRLLRRVSL